MLCGTTVLHLGHGRQLSPHQLTKGLRDVQSELLVYDGRLPLHRSVLTADGYRSRRWNGTSPDRRETDAGVAGVEYPEINRRRSGPGIIYPLRALRQSPFGLEW